MKIWHRIALNSDKTFLWHKVIDLGIKYKEAPLPGGTNSLVFFDIEESDPRWAILSKIMETHPASNVFDTFFDDEEIRKAEWSRLVSTFERGYPQPKLDWPLKQLTYENVCPKCAIHKQTRPMRIGKEPYMGKKSFMSSIWCGEIFCLREVIDQLVALGAKGFEPWDILLHKSGEKSSVIKQLFVTKVASPGLIVDNNYEFVICPVCGTNKYRTHMHGIMNIKREAIPEGSDFVLTHEWFGAGYIAFQEILVSNRVACLILDKAWMGARMKVVELV